MLNQEADFKEILDAVMKTYHDKMHAYLTGKPDGTLTDADVVIMIMNLTMNISTNVYYSVKQILSTTKVDYEFMTATIMNHLVDAFKNIKNYSPKETLMPLTVEQIKEIQEHGFTTITLADGAQRRVSKEELLVKKEDAKKIIEGAKHDAIAKIHTPKIILPGS